MRFLDGNSQLCIILCYTIIPGATPFVTVLSASETPAVSTENGVLTFSTGSCNASPPDIVDEVFDENTTEVPEGDFADSDITEDSGDSSTVSRTEDDTDKEVSSSSPATTSINMAMRSTGFLTAILAPRPYRGFGVLALLTTLFGSFATVNGAGHEAVGCKPSLELEISLPMGAEVTSKFGDTDHYLAATVDTVTWGYYDPNATAKISMESGETITVEIITHHSGHDYAKMIQGDPAVEEIFYWEINQTLEEKPEPKLPGSGVHLITGPIEVIGAEVGDVVQVDILELEPRYNPVTGRCFGTNSQKFAGYQYNSLTGEKRDGTEYTRAGGTEAITVFEFLEDSDGNMLYGKPVYMYRFPNMTAPDGSTRTFDNNPAVMIPHEFDMGYSGEFMSEDPIEYPPGFDGTVVSNAFVGLTCIIRKQRILHSSSAYRLRMKVALCTCPLNRPCWTGRSLSVRI